MTEQFAGTSTFLFTDIESSTSRWAEDRVAMAEALRVHDDAMGAAVSAHGGRVFKHTGDGVGAVFGSARQALEAAIEAQATVGLPVRMGLHTGEAQARDGDFFGPTVNRCARVMDAGHGGQILLSATTVALLEGVDLLDLGEHLLKGLPAPERILQLGLDRFPPLRVAAQASTLPPQRSTLVGRDALVEEVAGRLSPGQVLTLVGVGGVGKTRLAVAAAEAVTDRFDRVAFVDLATVSDGIEVLPALARALELTSATRDAVAVALTGRMVLLVLDNCEHVLGEAADVVEDVLEGSPTVSVLATSREGLALEGEQLLAVPGLDSEDAESPGVALFLGRAEQATSGFALDPADRPTVVEICRRLDGIPLAIELAAARTSVLSVGELADRLDHRFQVLTGGRRRRSRDRHRTLRETVDWSFDLLDEDEQEVFTRLGVFAGSFDLAGAVAVVGDRDEIEVLDLVAALVDKSLLTVVLGGGAPRYRYLETIRSYAEEKLDQSDESPVVIARLHAHEVERLTAITQEREPSYWLVDELPNIRRAFDDAVVRQDVVAATALVAPYLEIASEVPWISGWGDEVLALPGAEGSREEPVLRAARVRDAWMAGRFGELRGLADELQQVMAQWPVDVLPAALLSLLAVVHSLSGDDQAAAAFHERWALRHDDPALALSRRLGVQEFRLSARFPRFPALDGIDDDIADGLRSMSWMTRSQAHRLAVLQARERGDFDAMLRSARSAEQLSVEPSLIWFSSLQHQARAELGLGHLEEALRLADRNLDRAQRCGDRVAMVIPTVVFALVLQALDEPEAAAVVRALLPRRLTHLYVDELAALDDWLERRLAPETRAALHAEGRAKSPVEMQAFTQEVTRRHGVTPSGG